MLLFGGFYVNKDTIPDALSWIEYISHIQWAFTALCINEFEGQSGWKRKTFENKDWLKERARAVEQRARTWWAELQYCEEDLERPWWLIAS